MENVDYSLLNKSFYKDTRIKIATYGCSWTAGAYYPARSERKPNESVSIEAWPMHLANFLDPEEYVIYNFALGGSSIDWTAYALTEMHHLFDVNIVQFTEPNRYCWVRPEFRQKSWADHMIPTLEYDEKLKTHTLFNQPHPTNYNWFYERPDTIRTFVKNTIDDPNYRPLGGDLDDEEWARGWLRRFSWPLERNRYCAMVNYIYDIGDISYFHTENSRRLLPIDGSWSMQKELGDKKFYTLSAKPLGDGSHFGKKGCMLQAQIMWEKIQQVLADKASGKNKNFLEGRRDYEKITKQRIQLEAENIYDTEGVPQAGFGNDFIYD